MSPKEGPMMKDQPRERWKFAVSSPGADRVFLVQTCGEGTSTWYEMMPFGGSQFQLERSVAPGPHRYSYVVGEGATYINCGSDGLECRRLAEADAEQHETAIPA